MLFDFIKERLPEGFDFGDENQTLVDGVPDHKVFDQFIRNDHMGDVGIFEVYTTPQGKYNNLNSYISEVHIEVIARDGDVGAVKKYLKQLYLNIRFNRFNDNIYIDSMHLINMRPMGINESGNHWVVMNLLLKYKEQE